MQLSFWWKTLILIEHYGKTCYLKFKFWTDGMYCTGKMTHHFLWILICRCNAMFGIKTKRFVIIKSKQWLQMSGFCVGNFALFTLHLERRVNSSTFYQFPWRQYIIVHFYLMFDRQPTLIRNYNNNVDIDDGVIFQLFTEEC